MPLIKKYKVVVIDEIETFLKKWLFNETLHGVQGICYTNFISILKSADKIILLDAFITNITIRFLQNLGIQSKYIMISSLDGNDVFSMSRKCQQKYQDELKGYIEVTPPLLLNIAGVTIETGTSSFKEFMILFNKIYETNSSILAKNIWTQMPEFHLSKDK